MPPFTQTSRLPVAGSVIDGFTAAIERSIATGDEFSGVLGAAELAVALRRYRLDHGAYPDDLATLVPAYLSAIPVNPFTGKTPVYARQGEGFTLSAPQNRIKERPSPPTPEWTVNR